jgi:hypothetical protein
VVLDAAWSYWRRSSSDTSFTPSVILVYEDDVLVVVVDFAASVVISATILFPEVVSVSGIIRVLDASVVKPTVLVILEDFAANFVIMATRYDSTPPGRGGRLSHHFPLAATALLLSRGCAPAATPSLIFTKEGRKWIIGGAKASSLLSRCCAPVQHLLPSPSRSGKNGY